MIRGNSHLALGPWTLKLGNGAPEKRFEAYTQHHFKTVSSNINILAGPAYWSTIKTLPATLPEPRAKDRGSSFEHHGPRFGGRGS